MAIEKIKINYMAQKTCTRQQIKNHKKCHELVTD
jgi:hypothetical protein